jgi:hypothetical protein
MNIRPLKLKDTRFGDEWRDVVLDRWDYKDFKADPRWRCDWISFDCALYYPPQDRVYLGITSFDADIFKAYDRRTESFVDLGYRRIADPFDAKFHRALVLGPDGCLYAAVALLHDVDRYGEAPGSPIVKYDPVAGTLERLAAPLPHVYIQSLIADNANEMLYGLCFPPEKLCAYHVRTGAARDLGPISGGLVFAQGENIVLDDAGCVWSNWALTRAWQSEPGVDAVRLCHYDPRQGRIVFFQQGLPKPDGGRGYAKAEGLFNFHDGWLYASGANGSLYRIDPATARAEYLFTPTPDRPSRLAALVKGGDGFAYGVTGRAGQCELLRVDYSQGSFEKLGPIQARDGEPLWQCHDIVRADDGVLYVCENDHPRRSSYLWEIEL